MLLPANTGDPASMVAQAIAIFRQASNTSIPMRQDPQSATPKTEGSEERVESEELLQEQEKTETVQQTDTRFSLQKKK